LCLVLPEIHWLRRLAVIGILSVASFCLIGLLLLARTASARADPSLFRLQVPYGDAFRAGLVSAQGLVNSGLSTLLIAYACLAILAFVPLEPRTSAHARNRRP